MPLVIGIDLGTSGCRAVCVDLQGNQIAEASTSIEIPACSIAGQHRQDPDIWWQATLHVLEQLCEAIDVRNVQAMCTDGTSSSLLLTDSSGRPVSPALMYNDTSSTQAAEELKQLIPENSPAQGASSSLSKLLHLSRQFPQARYALHQADWITGKLSGKWGISDTNNCLKLGYDPLRQQWPDWIHQLNFNHEQLPVVLPPGSPAGLIVPELAQQLKLPADTIILTGTTDSTAAFIATGANQTGSAVTSLGSTLVTKIISNKPVSDSRYGIYSHRVFDFWLVGGASNSGGAAILALFSTSEIEMLTPLMKPEQPTGLDYYPLPAPGERFPIANPEMQPVQPDKLPADQESRAFILQGMFEGIARIEADAYKKLRELGAPYPTEVLSVGGGSVNPVWNTIRQQLLGVPVKRATHHQAAYGAAMLALNYIRK